MRQGKARVRDASCSSNPLLMHKSAVAVFALQSYISPHCQCQYLHYGASHVNMIVHGFLPLAALIPATRAAFTNTTALDPGEGASSYNADREHVFCKNWDCMGTRREDRTQGHALWRRTLMSKDLNIWPV